MENEYLYNALAGPTQTACIQPAVLTLKGMSCTSNVSRASHGRGVWE